MSETQTLKSEGVMYNIMAQKRTPVEWDLNDLLKKLDRLNEENAPSNDKEKSDDDEFNLDDFDMKDLDSSKEGNKDSDDKDDDDSLEDLDMGDMSDDDNSKKKDSDDQEDKDEFATDNAGLMNTINDLIAQGKTVKIVISQETGRPEFVVTDKSRSFQESKNSDPKVKKVKTAMNESKEKELNRILKGLISRYNKLSEDVQNIKTDASIDMSWIDVPSYDSYPAAYNASRTSAPINESNYNASLEEQTINLTADEFNDLVGVIEELDERSEALEQELYNTKMYQYNNSIIDEDLDNAIREADAAVNDLNESINADILQSNIRNTRVTSSRYAALNALGIYTNYITPNVLEISEAKGVLLSNVGGVNDANWSIPFHNGNIPSYSFNELDKALDRVDNLNVISQISTKFNESSMSPAAKLEAIKILDNAASAISFNSGNYGKYTYFSDYIDYILKDLKHKPSTDMGVAPDDSGHTMNIVRSSLPFMKPEEYNPKQTFNSAIINLEENLLDIDGKVKDFDMCDKVYLYKKVSSPTSLKDYAIPIASFNESDGQFYLNPILIEKSASMLKNESCMKLYDIPYREKLNELREKLLPYLERLNIVAPWLETV